MSLNYYKIEKHCISIAMMIRNNICFLNYHVYTTHNTQYVLLQNSIY